MHQRQDGRRRVHWALGLALACLAGGPAAAVSFPSAVPTQLTAPAPSAGALFGSAVRISEDGQTALGRGAERRPLPRLRGPDVRGRLRLREIPGGLDPRGHAHPRGWRLPRLRLRAGPLSGRHGGAGGRRLGELPGFGDRPLRSALRLRPRRGRLDAGKEDRRSVSLRSTGGWGLARPFGRRSNRTGGGPAPLLRSRAVQLRNRARLHPRCRSLDVAQRALLCAGDVAGAHRRPVARWDLGAGRYRRFRRHPLRLRRPDDTPVSGGPDHHRTPFPPERAGIFDRAVRGRRGGRGRRSGPQLRRRVGGLGVLGGFSLSAHRRHLGAGAEAAGRGGLQPGVLSARGRPFRSTAARRCSRP